jgi:putative membrane protein
MNTELQMPDTNQLALERTWMAHERTLMAWVRTAVSMISFGFTIYKFFQLDVGRPSEQVHMLLSPRLFSIAMISAGLFALGMALFSHHYEMLPMRRFLSNKRSLAQIFGLVIFLLGAIALVATIRRE